MKNPNEIFIKCDCHSEAISFEVDHEYEKDLTISVWTLSDVSSSGNLTFRDRFRYVWRILSKGRPYSDQVILAQDKAEQLLQYLENNYRDGKCVISETVFPYPEKSSITLQ